MRLFTLSDGKSLGSLRYGNLQFPAALGRGGIRAGKREGDGATPRGFWRAVGVYFRPDRWQRPRTSLPIEPLTRDCGWCDDPADRNYNRPVSLPYPASAERLWRNDRLYDIIIVLDYNLRRRTAGRGSAIFVHIAHRGLAPTEGCIALKREHLLRLLAIVPQGAVLAVGRNL
jgi:L,D-peptidoglycan transpeptidase YkuD (ErfK/YbiS/YcfS/YnhG family)